MQIGVANGDLMETTISILEPDPPSPIITIRIARATKDLERPSNVTVIIIETISGHPVLIDRHAHGLRIGVQHDGVEFIIGDGGAGVSDTIEGWLIGHGLA